MAEEGQESGLKIYVENSAGLSGVVMANGDWNLHMGYSETNLLTDEAGTYIWYPLEDAGSVSQLSLTSYWSDQPLKVLNVVAVAEEVEALAEIAETQVQVDLSEHLATAETEQGETAGIKVYLEAEGNYNGRIILNSWASAPEYNNEVLQEDEDGSYIFCEYSEEITNVEIVAYYLQTPPLYVTKLAIVEETEEAEEPLAEITETQVQIDLSEHLADAETEQGETAGIKVYLEAEGNYNGRIILNSWASAPEYNNEVLQEDEDGSYIFCEYSEEITNVEIVAYYLQTPPLYVTKLVLVEETGETEEPLAELSATGATESLVEYLENADRESGEEAGVKIYLEGQGSYNGAIILNNDWNNTVGYSNSELASDEEGNYVFCGYENLDELQQLDIVAYYLESGSVYVTKLVIVESQETQQQPVEQLSLMNELMEEEIPTATNSNALQSDTLQEPIEPVKEETEADSTPDIPEASKPEDQFPPTEDENQKQEQDDNQDSDPEDDVTSSDETEDTGEADEEGEKDEEISKDDSQEPDSETGSQDAQENETSEEDDTESDDVQEGETSQDTDTETDDAQETEKEDSDDTGYEDTDTEDADDADDEDTDSKDTGSQDTASAPDTGSNSGESADDQSGIKDQSGEKGGSDEKEKSEGEGKKDDSDSGRKQESDEKTDEAGGRAE